uniref:Ig-like domain-containing protein n=1 Tax=Poecilia formosa TaxID=48698 RepID=A0A096LS25_POEFO
LYHRAGDEAALPCDIMSSSSSSCHDVNWFYNTDKNQNTQLEVQDGNVVQSSSRASRLHMNSNCSLIINNITAEDAGWFSCRSGSGSTLLYLSVLTISPSDADPSSDGAITLRCSLWRHSVLGSCPHKSLRWLNETGGELFGEGDGYKFGGQADCDSFLTVNLQSSRRFTCQFVEGNEVKVEAHY